MIANAETYKCHEKHFVDLQMKVFGLTGGIASGKTVVAERFRELGIPVLDADKAGHRVIGPSGSVRDEVVDAFGGRILDGGEIDRKRLGKLVFREPEAREKLNRLVHPAIRTELERRCLELERDGHRFAVIEAALFGEGHALEPELDGLILVRSSRETRLKRLVAHRGLSPGQARQRLDAQPDPEKKLAHARWVMDNEGSKEALREQATHLAQELAQAART